MFDTFAEKRRQQAKTGEPYYFDFGAYLEDLDTHKWKSFSPQVYAIFWQLELQDIELPTEMYKAQIAAKEQQQAAIRGDKDDNKRKRQALDSQVKELQNELRNHQSVRHAKVKEFLSKNLSGMFETIQDQFGVS